MAPSPKLLPTPDVLAALCREHGVRRLALFGSVLREDFTALSDVDVLVEFEPGRTPGFFGLFDLADALSPLFGGRKIDLRTAEDLSPYFRAEVLSSSQPLYDAA
ncbi:MAG: nucleotidyltransferase family protein [Planctomycetota bacterium]